MIWAIAGIGAAVAAVALTLCAGHARRVERDQAEINDYRGYTDLGDPLHRRMGRP